MNLLEIILVVAAGIGIDVAVGLAAIGLARRPHDPGRLALAVAALALALGAVAVVLGFHADEPAAYVAIFKWVYFPASVAWLVATVWAVAFYSRWVPRRALLALSAGLAAMIILNVALPSGLLFARSDALELVQILGSSVAFLNVPPSPLVLINEALVVLALIFLLYAPLRAYRGSSAPAARRRALAVGAVAVVYTVTAAVEILTTRVVIRNPFLTVAGYVGLLLVVVVVLHVQSVAAERELQRHRAHLEELVAERVKDLADANRQLAEEARRRQASEEQYRLLAENSSDVVFRANNRAVFEWISPATEQLLGWTPEQLVGRAGLELVHPDDAERARTLHQAVADGSSVTFEMRFLKADGDYRWVSASVRALRDASGVVIGRVGSWRDAQAAVEARTALTESEERFRAAFDAVDEFIGLLRPVVDAQGEFVDAEILWANRLVLQRWFGGRELEEVRGTHLLARMLPRTAERLRAPFRAAAQEGRTSSLNSHSGRRRATSFSWRRTSPRSPAASLSRRTT